MGLGMASKLVWPLEVLLSGVQDFLWLFQSAAWHSREQYCPFWHFAQRLSGLESSDWASCNGDRYFLDFPCDLQKGVNWVETCLAELC